MKKVIFAGAMALLFSCGMGVANAYDYNKSVARAPACACTGCACDDCKCTDCSAADCTCADSCCAESNACCQPGASCCAK